MTWIHQITRVGRLDITNSLKKGREEIHDRLVVLQDAERVRTPIIIASVQIVPLGFEKVCEAGHIDLIV
jgi:hypothetical protein